MLGSGNAAAWLAAGFSGLRHAILHGNGGGGAQVGAGTAPRAEYEDVDPRLLDARYGANLDPRIGSKALRAEAASADGAEGWEQARYRGATCFTALAG